MTFPTGVTTCILSIGSSLSFFGDSGSMSVVVTPVIGGGAQYIVWGATGDPFIAAPKTFTSVVGSPVQVTVPHVDQPGFIGPSGDAVTMWAYNISVKATVNGKDISWVKNVQPEQDQTAIDVDLTPDGPIALVQYAPIPAVLSVNGQTGNVTIDEGGGEGAVTSVAGRQGDVTLTSADLTDSTATGRSLVVAASAAAVRAAIQLQNVTNDAQLKASQLDTDPTMAANSNARVASQAAAKAYADALIAAANATVYKGVIDCSTNPNYPAADAGWMYVISVAGKIGGASGVTVEPGDMALCIADATPAGNQATVGAVWDVIQVNVAGAVIGPASSTDGHVATYDQATGKVIKDSGVAISSVIVTGDSRLADPRKPIAANWTATTVYAQFELAVRVADGVIIRRNTAGTSRASYDGTEAALWTALSAPATVGYADLPAGSAIYRYKPPAGSWQTCPTDREDLHIVWMAHDPADEPNGGVTVTTRTIGAVAILDDGVNPPDEFIVLA